MVSAEPSDVSAVVLTIGESTTQEAIDSIERQTLRPCETIIVRNISPFHDAMNTGVAQVRTPFFVQVDADMILDPHCIAALRHGMRPNIGIVVARLRDALVGQVVGVKLFRTKCFETSRFSDSITPDTDFANAIEHAGWRTRFIGKTGAAELDHWDSFGEHRPAYTPAYAYRQHLLEAFRYRYRGTLQAFLWRLHRLEASQHPFALMAQIGLARGLFLEGTRDLLGTGGVDEGFSRLDAFLNEQPNVDPDRAAVPALVEGAVQERFFAAYRTGAVLLAAGDAPEFRRLMVEFDDREGSDLRWVCKAALCQGLLAHTGSGTTMEADYERLREFADPDHDAITKYAGAAELDRFVVTGAIGAEYKASRRGERRIYRRSQRAVVSSVDRRGRPRITLPFRLFGHLACAEPERLSGMLWCLDLLKAGYIHAHVPTDRGPKKVSVLGQVARNIAERAALNLVLPTSWDRTFRKLSQRRNLGYRPVAGRVLMIVPSFMLGGAERQMVAAATGLVRRGYDVCVLAINPIDDDIPNVEDELSRLGIATAVASDFRTPRSTGWAQPQSDASSAFALSGLPPWLAEKIGSISLAIQHHRPAVIHTWLDVAAVMGGLAACGVGVPRIVGGQFSMSIRHHVNQAVGYLQSGYRHVARNPDVVMTNDSAAGAADYENWLDIAPGRIRVMYNGFDPATVRKPALDEIRRFRAELGFPAEAPVVGSLIRFVEDKDPALWLDTAAEIARDRPDARFLLAGYGPLRGTIVGRARALGLGDRLVLPGAVSDVGLVYAILDVVLLTSRVEGVPNVLIEAQAAGCAVVSVDVGGTSEAVIDGRTGRLVRQRTPHSLAQAVLATLADPAWRIRARCEGPAFVATRFGFRPLDQRNSRGLRVTRASAGILQRATFGLAPKSGWHSWCAWPPSCRAHSSRKPCARRRAQRLFNRCCAMGENLANVSVADGAGKSGMSPLLSI